MIIHGFFATGAFFFFLLLNRVLQIISRCIAYQSFVIIESDDKDYKKR